MPSTFNIEGGSGFFSLELQGLNEINRWLDQGASELGKTKPMLEEGRIAWRDHIRAVFESEGASVGTPWPALHPITVLLRGSANPILNVTGSLAHAAAMEQESFQAREERSSYGDHAEVRTDRNYETVRSSYAISDDKLLFSLSGPETAHQDGYVNELTGNWVPARPFWPWGDAEQDLFFTPFEKWADGWLDLGV